MSAYKIFSHIWSSITKFIPSEAEPTYYSSLVLYSEHIVLRMCKMIQYSTHTEKYCHHSEMLNSSGSNSAHTALSHSYCLLLLPPPSYHLHHCHYNWGSCHPLFFQSASLLWLPSFSCSVRIRCCVMSATLLCPLTTSLLLLLSFLLVLIFNLIFSLAFAVLRTPAFSASHFVVSLCLFTWLPRQLKYEWVSAVYHQPKSPHLKLQICIPLLIWYLPLVSTSCSTCPKLKPWPQIASLLISVSDTFQLLKR